MCLWTSKGDSRTFPLSVHEVEEISYTNATANRDKEREPILLFGRESTLRTGAVDTEHKCSPSNCKVCDSHKTTRCKDRPASRLLTATTTATRFTLLLTHTTLVPSAGLASLAKYRILNTWRNSLQAYLLRTTHEIPQIKP